MKRLVTLLIICLLIPSVVFAQQVAGAFVQGLANGLAMSRGYVPPCQPQIVLTPTMPQTTSGTIYSARGMDLFTITQTPITGQFFGTIYNPHGMKMIQGNQY